MEKTMAPLTGVARAKYMRDFTRKINQSDRFGNIFNGRGLGKSRKVLDSKAALKKKRKVEPKTSVKLQKKDINQEYIVQRMKFLRQSIEVVNEAVNNTTMKKPPLQPPPVIRIVSKFEQFKNKSFEIEKQKLNELYKADIHNINSTMEPIEEPKAEVRSTSSILKSHPDELKHTKEILEPCTTQALISNPVCEISLQDLQPSNADQTTIPAELQKQPESDSGHVQIDQPESSEPTIRAPESTTDEVLQLCQNQLQNINLNSNNSNALVPSNSIPTSRRICHRNKRNKRYLVKPFCAHCHDLITEVAYFSGTQQLCFECADRHYERVTRARYRDRPMGYREFKNIGGDTIYSRS